MSAFFTFIHYSQAHIAYDNQSNAFAEHVSRAIAGDLADGNLLAVEQALDNLLPGKAIVETGQGEIIVGEISAAVRAAAAAYPVMHNQTRIATLVSAPLVPYKPAIPYVLGVALCFAVAGGAAFFIYLFSKLVSGYIQQVTRIVEGFSLKTAQNYNHPNPIFSELRALNVATVRTTRRMAREIRLLREQAKFDSRTGLFNENSLLKKIEHVLETAQYDNPAALIVIDLQDQSSSAESVSYTHSDPAIKTITNILKALVREGERSRGLPAGSWVLASLFSDQFAILVQGFGARDDLASLIREVQMAFRAPLPVADRALPLTLSGSIVMIPEDGDTVNQIRQRADATILDIKRQGRAGFSFYSPKLERQRDALVKLEVELRQAVANDRFIPLFQPKVDLATGQIIGAEALARWRLDSGRLVSPSVFIQLAEETGLINVIGEQILRKACMEAAQWNQRGHRLNIAVNVSPRQFERDGLAQKVLDALAASGLSPRQLEIEITESLAIDHPERVRAVLTPLRKLGIKLAVDDFGTGHSNLATLTQLDFDVFKIDRQFVSGTPHESSANAIVEMILGMANTLEMQIVGEGIETQPQAEFLQSKGCHIGQGFLYSPPVTAEAFRKMLDEQPFVPSRLIA